MKNLVGQAYEATYATRMAICAKKLSAMHLLYSEAISLFDEVTEELDNYQKIVRDVKMVTKRLDFDFKTYNDVMQKLISSDQNKNLCADLEDFDKQFRRFARIEDEMDINNKQK